MNKRNIYLAIIRFALFCVFLVIVVLIAHHSVRQSLPKYSGVVACEGIHSEVRIYRDSLAIPYIYASTETDGAFALGYLHAQERLFQMDMARRAGSGRLSQIFGKRTLDFDKMFLTIGIERIAKKMWEAEPPESKKILIAYANGVNEFIQTHATHLSIEFDALNYIPGKWEPYHSLIIVRLIAWELNIAWWEDFTFTMIASQLGKAKASKLLPDYIENKDEALPDTIHSFTPQAISFLETDRAFREFCGNTGTHIGSNNWVVSGEKSVSGKPIIANDPHLAHQSPAKWYIANIDAGKWKAQGVTLPGVPAVVIGKNTDISWTLTNVMADDADFYIEKVNSQLNEYLVDNQWKPIQRLHYTIPVRDTTEYSFNVFLTHRGPLVSNIHTLPLLYHNKMDSIQFVSMRWTGNDVSDEFSAFLRINFARTWSEFREGVKMFTVPGQNFVYADRQGNIGYICGAKLPIRRSGNHSFASDGTISQNDWSGFIPFEQMPELFNPSQQYIATANNKVMKNFQPYITNLWEPTSRIDRINHLLNQQSKYSVNDFIKFQADVVSPYADSLNTFICKAFNGIKVNDKNLKTAIELLSFWDGAFHSESQTPAIYAMFFQCLLRNTLLDDLGEDLFNEYCFVANVPYRTMLRIISDNSNELFDDIRTAKIETRDEIIRKSLSDALGNLENLYGNDLKNWQWGNLHQVTFKHSFHGQLQALDKTMDIGPFPVGGDGTTIFNTEYTFYKYSGEISPFRTTQFENNLGPSMRFIYDFNEPESYYIILPTGQSSNIYSPHYKDMTELWLNGSLLKIKFSRDFVLRNTQLLSLVPK